MSTRTPILKTADDLPAAPRLSAAETMAIDEPVPIGSAYASWLEGKNAKTVRKYIEAAAEFGRFLAAPDRKLVLVEPDGEGGEAVEIEKPIPVRRRKLPKRPKTIEDREILAQTAMIRLCSARPDRAALQVRDWVSWQQSQDLAPNTINQRVSAVRSFVEAAQMAGLVTWVLPKLRVKAELVRDTTGPAWADVLKMIDTVRARPDSVLNRRDIAVMLLLATHGLRRFELASIRVCDIDLDECTVMVIRKRNAHRVRVPLNAPACDAICAWREVYSPSTKDAPLFPGFTKHGPRDTGLSGQAVWHLVRSVAKEAGLDPVSPHGLRHSFGTKLDELLGRAVAQAGLGHANDATTGVYLDDEDRKRMTAARRGVDALGETLDVEAS